MHLHGTLSYGYLFMNFMGDNLAKQKKNCISMSAERQFPINCSSLFSHTHEHEFERERALMMNKSLKQALRRARIARDCNYFH